ncbi:MAG: hypothetical protein QNJ71_08680 [Acidimicrobiia bacterium]|nr:hypothetical protein [Acidimicrobiia bacterium]
MHRAALIAVVTAIIVSSCAATDDASTPEGASGVSGAVEETVGSEGEGSMTEDPMPPNPIPENQTPENANADLPGNDGDAPSDDPATSGLADPGDPPPPADDSDSLVSGGSIPREVVTAQADLANRLGISEDVIDWVSHEEVDWPDGSLGCPQPGMVYTQAIVNGTLTVFEVDGVEYRYHAGGGRDPFLCEQPRGDAKGGDTSPPTTISLDE